MTRLSVNINKIALIRNSRGSDMPNLLKVALDCETFGAQGITVHPRPDQRHIRYDDIPVLRKGVHTEFNIEGNPEDDFMQLVLQSPPHQCTLVPDAPSQLTSDAGWDTVKEYLFLKDITKTLQNAGIRVSIFINADKKHVEGAKKIGADRIEFYTGNFAHSFHKNPEKAVAAHKKAALVAEKVGMGVNAGHDLNLHNLQYYRQNVPNLLEVSIGHAIVCDALYYGLHNTIQMYLNKLK